jgi:hypothetical protein
VQALTAFVGFLAPNSEQVAARLDSLQKAHSITDDSPDISGGSGLNELDVAAIQLQAVTDLPPFHSRGGLYIFLSALVGDSIAKSQHIVDRVSLLHDRSPMILS